VNRIDRQQLLADIAQVRIAIVGAFFLEPYWSLDPVGAGNSMLADIAAALDPGRDAGTAATPGSLAAAITVRKLFRTGTASPAEILNLLVDGDPIHP